MTHSRWIAALIVVAVVIAPWAVLFAQRGQKEYIAELAKQKAGGN